MNNYWLNDEMLPSIATLPNLVFLNLGYFKFYLRHDKSDGQGNAISGRS